MKIIDLLNNRHHLKDLPEEIIFNGIHYILNNDSEYITKFQKDCINDNNYETLIEHLMYFSDFEDEVEILDKKDKEIEKTKRTFKNGKVHLKYLSQSYEMSTTEVLLADKIDELIAKVNNICIKNDNNKKTQK